MSLDNSASAPYRPLRCTACGLGLMASLVYTGHGYSEHRDHDGYECLDCYATWDKNGDPTPGTPPDRTPDAVCANCATGLQEPWREGGDWLHLGGWKFCPILPDEEAPTRVATPANDQPAPKADDR